MRKILYLLFLFCALPCMVYAQNNQITGVVTDATDGSPLIGVTVQNQKKVGVMTDIDGKYSIKVNKGDILSFSFLGMETVNIKVEDQTTIDVALKENSVLLTEAVVVGYGTMKKSDLTGALSSLKSNQLTQLSAVDVTQSIQGRAPGVSVVSNSGEPGSGTKIRIRGTGSVNNSDPLYVVDGFPVNDLSHIAPHDIEAMEILKDASAVAIYGSRGANGVVLVKTKAGNFGQKTQISVNVFGGYTKVAKTLEMLNAEEFGILKLEAYKNAGLTPSLSMQSMLDYAIANKSVGTNWQDEILRSGITQNYNVNISGGTDRNKYDFGSTYSRETGVIKNTYLDKFLFHLNNEYKIFKNAKIGVNLSYVTFMKSGNNNDFFSGSLTQAIKTDPISAAWDDYTNNFGQIYFSYAKNPAQSVYENKLRSSGQDRFTGSAYLQIDDIAIKGLSFRAQFGKQFSFSKDRNYYEKYYIAPDQQNPKSSLNETRSDNTFWNTNGYFSYVNTFGKHNINATLGVEAQKSEWSNMFAQVYDVPMDSDLRYLGTAADKEKMTVSGGADHNALLSGFFRFNYNYASRYLFTGTVRGDGTSKFKKRWGYFPSFSAGWNINEEAFMNEIKGNSPITQLKLRAGWGHVGNQASAGNFDYLALMTNGYTTVMGGNVMDGVIQQKLANEDLSWETSEQYNLGLDYALFNSTLSGSVDYFVRNTNDMILDTPVPIYVGKWRTKTNAGSVRNSGVEFNLNYQNTLGKDFSFNANFNISFIKNKVTSLGGGEPLYAGTSLLGNITKTEVGHEIGYFYGLQSAGIFKTDAQLAAHQKDGEAIQPNAALGDVIFVDQNGDGLINDEDRVYLGSATPDYTYGISLSATYKGLDLNAFFQGSQGNEIANYMYLVQYSTGMKEYSNSKAMMGRWTPENPNSDLPRVHAADPNRNDRFSSRYVENGSYFRLKTLQLGYTLPQSISKKVFLSKARFYVSTDNLFTITKYSGYNPEMGDLWGNPLMPGVDMATYPTPRVFTIGCNLNF